MQSHEDLNGYSRGIKFGFWFRDVSQEQPDTMQQPDQPDLRSEEKAEREDTDVLQISAVPHYNRHTGISL